jgi:hypothetical protein
MGWRKVLFGTSSILLFLSGIQSVKALDIGKTIEKSLRDTGHAIEKATQDTGKAIEKGTHDAGKAIETEHSPSDPCKTTPKLPQCGELGTGGQNR